MKYYVEAYDKDNREILGNLDGQGVIRAKLYRRTLHYKSLATRRTLGNRVKFYRIVDGAGNRYEDVTNTTFQPDN